MSDKWWEEFARRWEEHRAAYYRGFLVGSMVTLAAVWLARRAGWF
jgi:hypothetical protein